MTGSGLIRISNSRHGLKPQFRDLAARFRASFALEPFALRSEGAGNAGRPMRPIAACAMMVVERTRVSQVTPEIARHSPRNGLRLTSCSSRRSAFLPPSPLRSLLLRNLTPASRRQNHTTSPSARKTPSSLALLASTASCPASVTISSRPSVGQDGRGYKVIWVFGKSEYFCKEGWTGKSLICPSGYPGWVSPTGPRKTRPDDRLRRNPPIEKNGGLRYR